jgi:hypothetical protein
LIDVKDWANPPSDHVDPYHLGIRFVEFLTAVLAEIYLAAVCDLLAKLLPEAVTPRQQCSSVHLVQPKPAIYCCRSICLL